VTDWVAKEGIPMIPKRETLPPPMDFIGVIRTEQWEAAERLARLVLAKDAHLGGIPGYGLAIPSSDGSGVYMPKSVWNGVLEEAKRVLGEK
jgi:hypothetical protein